jgi:hypothetical protein
VASLVTLGHADANEVLQFAGERRCNQVHQPMAAHRRYRTVAQESWFARGDPEDLQDRSEREATGDIDRQAGREGEPADVGSGLHVVPAGAVGRGQALDDPRPLDIAGSPTSPVG